MKKPDTEPGIGRFGVASGRQDLDLRVHNSRTSFNVDAADAPDEQPVPFPRL